MQHAANTGAADFIQDSQYSILDETSKAFQPNRGGSALSYQRGSSALSSQAVMPRISAVKAAKGDSTLIGISKAYQTGTTAITSNPDNFSVTQTGMNASIHP